MHARCTAGYKHVALRFSTSFATGLGQSSGGVLCAGDPLTDPRSDDEVQWCPQAVSAICLTSKADLPLALCRVLCDTGMQATSLAVRSGPGSRAWHAGRLHVVRCSCLMQVQRVNPASCSV